MSLTMMFIIMLGLRQNRDYFLYFANGETEVQRNSVICPSLHSKLGKASGVLISGLGGLILILEASSPAHPLSTKEESDSMPIFEHLLCTNFHAGGYQRRGL